MFTKIFSKTDNYAKEEGIKIKEYGNKISKQLKVFYNPVMKLNRDLSLLVIKTYFTKYNNKKIKFCDPMAASGIRELRFLNTIPELFDKFYVGDISKSAILNIQKNAKINKISLKNVNLYQQDAISTLNQELYDYIEIDPFGSPIPFLDLALQNIKHKTILSVTATDTAALCGTYPKTTLRKYNIKVKKTYWFEELGLRNLIAYCQIQAGKYDKFLTPMLTYTQDHYYKIFFEVKDGRTEAFNSINNLKYINWDKKTQQTIIEEYESKTTIGKTYVGNLCNKIFLEDLKENLNLIKDSKKAEKLINKLIEEIDIVGYYNPNQFQKHFKFASEIKFEDIIKKLKNEGFQASRTHNSKFGIKTNCPYEKFIEIIKT